MKALLTFLALLASLLSTFGASDPTLFARVGGKESKLNGQPVFWVEIPRSVHKAVNAGRKLTGKQAQDFKTVNSELWSNQEYLSDWLTLVENELAAELDKRPTGMQIFAAWKLGGRAFKRISYDVAQVKDGELVAQLGLFQALSQNVKAFAPAPLPTDGRRPIPSRYPKEGTVQSQYRDVQSGSYRTGGQ